LTPDDEVALPDIDRRLTAAESVEEDLIAPVIPGLPPDVCSSMEIEVFFIAFCLSRPSE